MQGVDVVAGGMMPVISSSLSFQELAKPGKCRGKDPVTSQFLLSYPPINPTPLVRGTSEVVLV